MVQTHGHDGRVSPGFNGKLNSNPNDKWRPAGGEEDQDKDQDYSYANIARETKLLREVKDICDELNILKTLAEDQEHVWKQFWDPEDVKSHTFNYDTPLEIKTEIEEMIKEAESVLAAFHMLLDLKQKQANIAEAQNTRRQSDTMMVFTVITILFCKSQSPEMAPGSDLNPHLLFSAPG